MHYANFQENRKNFLRVKHFPIEFLLQIRAKMFFVLRCTMFSSWLQEKMLHWIVRLMIYEIIALPTNLFTRLKGVVGNWNLTAIVDVRDVEYINAHIHKFNKLFLALVNVKCDFYPDVRVNISSNLNLWEERAGIEIPSLTFWHYHVILHHAYVHRQWNVSMARLEKGKRKIEKLDENQSISIRCVRNWQGGKYESRGI